MNPFHRRRDPEAPAPPARFRMNADNLSDTLVFRYRFEDLGPTGRERPMVEVGNAPALAVIEARFEAFKNNQLNTLAWL